VISIGLIVGGMFMGMVTEGFELHAARIETAVGGYCQVSADPVSLKAIEAEEKPETCLYEDSEDILEENKWDTKKGTCQHTWGDDWVKQMEVGDKGETCKFEVMGLIPTVHCPCFYESKMGLHITSNNNQINAIIQSGSGSGCGVTKWNEGQWDQEEPPAKGSREAEKAYTKWTTQEGRGYEETKGYHCMAIKGNGDNFKDELLIGFEKGEYVKGMGELVDLMGSITGGIYAGAVILLLLGIVGCFFGFRRYKNGRFCGKNPDDVVAAPMGQAQPVVQPQAAVVAKPVNAEPVVADNEVKGM